MYCQWCTDGVDDTCGNGCGQTTFYEASFPSADECDWVQTNVNDYGQYPLGNNATMTADECIELAWNDDCEIANYHDASQTCKCQSGEDQTVEYGSEYRSCFLDEWRSDWEAWLEEMWNSGYAVVVIAIFVGPCCCCACFVVVYCCCCRSNDRQSQVPAQQPTQVIMVPQQVPAQMVAPKQQIQMPGGGQQQYNYEY